MQDAVLNFLRSPFVPEVFAQIAAGPPDDRQLGTIPVVAARAFPFVVAIEDDFPVKAAFVAVIQLRVEFSVGNAVVNILDHRQDGGNVMDHVRDFCIADAAPCRFIFKFRFKGKFFEDIDGLADVDVVAVRVVPLVGHVLDDTEAGRIDFAEAVRQVFRRRAVQGKADVRLFLPPLDVGVEFVHNAVGKPLSFRSRMGAALREKRRFVYADISQGQGRVAAVHKFFNRFSRLEASNGPILPVNGRHVGRNLFEQFYAQQQGLFAQLQPFMENLEKLVFVAVGQNADLRQVNRHDAHIEAAVELIAAPFVFPGAQEGAAAHGAEYVAFVGFPHLLGRNIVGIHALGRAFGSQLGQIEIRAALADVVLVQYVYQFRKGRRDVDVGLVFDALNALAQQFLVDEGRFLRVFVVRLEIHEQGDEGSLAVRGHERINLVLNRLDTVLNFLFRPLPGYFFSLFHIRLDAVDFLLFFYDGFHVFVEGLADVRSQNAVDAVDGLAAVLAAGYLGDDLRRHRTGYLERLRRVDFLAVDDRAVGQHVFQIDEAAVEHRLDDVIHVVEMNGPAVVSLDDVGGNELAAGNVLGHLTGDQIALRRHDVAVFIGIFIKDLEIGVVQQAEDV